MTEICDVSFMDVVIVDVRAALAFLESGDAKSALVLLQRATTSLECNTASNRDDGVADGVGAIPSAPLSVASLPDAFSKRASELGLEDAVVSHVDDVNLGKSVVLPNVLAMLDDIDDIGFVDESTWVRPGLLACEEPSDDWHVRTEAFYDELDASGYAVDELINQGQEQWDAFKRRRDAEWDNIRENGVYDGEGNLRRRSRGRR